MPEDGPFSKDISPTWKFALIGGLASLPFTTLSYWQTGSELSFNPVFFGGVLAGYLSTRNLGTSSSVGVRAGIIGSLPIVWMLFDILEVTSGLSGPSWFVASGTILAIGFIVLGFGLAALVGKLGAKVGAWIARKTTGGRHTDANHA